MDQKKRDKITQTRAADGATPELKMTTKMAYKIVRRFLRMLLASEPELVCSNMVRDQFELGPNHDPMPCFWVPEEVQRAMSTLFESVDIKAYKGGWRPEVYKYWSFEDYGIVLRPPPPPRHE